MSNQNKKKLINFSYTTTYLESYKKCDDLLEGSAKFKRATRENPPHNPPIRKFMDSESFTPLRKQIPISLMAFPNEITGQDPHEKIKHIVLPDDKLKDEVMKTRPRIYKSPQISIDDVLDPEERKLILDYTYTSDFRKAEQELLSMVGIEYRNVPDTVLEHDKFLSNSQKHYFAVDFKPKLLMQNAMSSHLNAKGKEWTNEQLIAVPNVTEKFWQKKDVTCGACDHPILTLIEEKTKDKIDDLVHKDKLGIHHDKTCPNYAGFKPHIAIGVSLAKRDISSTHPLLSTYQATFNSKSRNNDNPKAI
ncbi:hypothetical protein HHI36_005328 [Cryptolaemus montrouzieri]|uniref:Uncharacterized protein n=1 Tax=Cryptolaemus montrouzieri TaxID=559131 RepID=A0ABD2NTW4_9CUCU